MYMTKPWHLLPDRRHRCAGNKETRREMLDVASRRTVTTGARPGVGQMRTWSEDAKMPDMSPIAPGVRPVRYRIDNAQEAAARVAQLAAQAAGAGTFGVGGLLIDGKGTVIAEAVNAVVRN